jgi:hypothetical protein
MCLLIGIAPKSVSVQRLQWQRTILFANTSKI